MNNSVSKRLNFTPTQIELEQANLHETYILTNYISISHVMVCMPTEPSQSILTCKE